MSDKRIFLSYCWDDSVSANRLDALLARFQIRLTRDIRDLNYNTSIHDFMDSMRTHDKLIVLVSDSYLRSVNCMYEASQVLDMQDKVVIILKKDTRLFRAEEKAALIDYWKNKLQETAQWDPLLFQQEIADTQIACNTIGAFLDYVKQDNRMNDESLDFEVLLNCLQVEKSFPTIITKTVLDWIAASPKAKLFDVLALIHDLYCSQYIRFSEYPGIPDKEIAYIFQKILFERDFNGVNLRLTVTDRKTGQDLTITYPHLVFVEENAARSDVHAKYHLNCENPSKKQRYHELAGLLGTQMLTEEEQDILTSGYIDIYRVIIHFDAFDSYYITQSEPQQP